MNTLNVHQVPVGNIIAAILAWVFFGHEVGIIALLVVANINFNPNSV